MTKRDALNRLLQRRELALVANEELGERAFDYDLRRLLERLGVTCVLDVGANCGQFRERIAARCGWAGPVVSFEPIARYAAVLRGAGAGRSDWRVVESALGAVAEDKAITLFDSPGLASLRTPRLNAMRELLPKHVVQVIGRETIRVQRLDDVFAEATRGLDTSRVFLKIDTQGYELEVLAGAGAVLERVVAVQAELSLLPIYDGMPAFTEVLERAKALGFEPSGIYPVTRDPRERLIEVDCLFVASRDVAGARQQASAA